MSEQTPEERAHWQDRLDDRSKRFAKLVALRAPSYVLCSDFLLLMRTVAALCPDAFAQVLAAHFQKTARIEHGRCVICGASHERDTGEQWCEKCEAEIRAEVEADDLADGSSQATPKEEE